MKSDTDKLAVAAIKDAYPNSLVLLDDEGELWTLLRLEFPYGPGPRLAVWRPTGNVYLMDGEEVEDGPAIVVTDIS